MRTKIITLKQDKFLLTQTTIITLFILIGSLVNNINAQTNIGIRGGLQLSERGINSSIGNTAAITKGFTGIDMALIAEFELGKISLQPELGYTERGIRMNTGTDVNIFGASVPIGITTTTKIRSLELPLMAKYKFGTGTFNGYAIAGPSLSYLLNGQFKTTGNLLAEVDLLKENFNLGNQNRFGLGLSAGGGIEMQTASGSVFMDARYNHQALKIKNLPVSDINFNNNGISFNIGYKVNI